LAALFAAVKEWQMISLVWFKRDLRIDDHGPLADAARQGAVLPVYIIEPDYWQQPDTSARQWHFIEQSLQLLDQQLTALGQPLLVIKGPATLVLKQLCQDYPISQVLSHEETGNLWTFQRDLAVKQLLKELAIPWRQYQQHAVFRALNNRDLWAEQADHYLSGALYQRPAFLPFIAKARLPIQPFRPQRLLDLPPCSFAQTAMALPDTLQSFFSHRAKDYSRHISLPQKALHSSSRLSPYLAYGQLSLRALQQQTLRTIKKQPALSFGLSSFYSRLRWHCHFIQKLESDPLIETEALHPGYARLRKQDFNTDWFWAWRNGYTGYPLIDACMRSLLATGWLHFRARAMLVAFACYHLWLDWRPVALHLAQCFVDYEPGIHYPQIQMQAGTTGINPNRMYNPVLQSQQKDPQGIFIKRWCPELALLPESWLHQPWLMPLSLQRQYGCVLGRDYPMPVVELQQAMRLAKQRITECKQSHDSQWWRQQKNQVVERHASRKRPSKRSVKSSAANGQLNLDLNE
jgi:deoxyribodipyrimidine photo-lyase